MGIVVKRPPGQTVVDGEMLDNEDIAKKIIDTINRGGDVTIPTDWDVYAVNHGNTLETIKRVYSEYKSQLARREDGTIAGIRLVEAIESILE